MATLKWEDVPEKTVSKSDDSASTSNVWFAATIGMIGIIVGYIIPHFIR